MGGGVEWHMTSNHWVPSHFSRITFPSINSNKNIVFTWGICLLEKILWVRPQHRWILEDADEFRIGSINSRADVVRLVKNWETRRGHIRMDDETHTWSDRLETHRKKTEKNKNKEELRVMRAMGQQQLCDGKTKWKRIVEDAKTQIFIVL